MSNPSSSTRVWFSEHISILRLDRHQLTPRSVTGTSQGLGLALLKEVLESGERAVATLRNPAALASAVWVEHYGPNQLLVVPLDVTNQEQIDAAFEKTKEHFGRLDVVVNNAGYALMGEIEGTPDDEARKAMEVMFWGPVNIIKQVCSVYLLPIDQKSQVCDAGYQVHARRESFGARWTRAERELHRGLQREPRPRVLPCRQVR